jgi:hypothetical protein
MQLMRYAAALVAIVISNAVYAAPPAGKHVDTTGDFIAICSVSTDDPAYAAAMGFCLGYIDAALDYHAALTAGERFKPIVCPHTEVTREEVVAVFLAWSKSNPRYVGTGSPVENLMQALYEKWPCSGQ